MATEKTYRGYNLEEILWWVKRLGKNLSMHTEAGEFRLVFSHKSCGTQELYGSIWTVAKNAMDAIASAVDSAELSDMEAFAQDFPESVSA